MEEKHNQKCFISWFISRIAFTLSLHYSKNSKYWYDLKGVMISNFHTSFIIWATFAILIQFIALPNNLKKCLALLCQQIKNVKPQAGDFLGPQWFLTRQNLFVWYDWEDMKNVLHRLRIHYFLTRSNIQNAYEDICFRKHTYTYAPFVALIHHLEEFCKWAVITMVATFVTVVIRLLVIIIIKRKIFGTYGQLKFFFQSHFC